MNNFVAVAKKHKAQFLNKTKKLKSESRGMTKSELLLIYSTIRELGVKRVIESGRARGFSTQVLAAALEQDYQIISVDFDTYGRDCRYSKKLLRKYDNVTLLHGDSRRVLPKLLGEDCVIILDGPKGLDAIVLAAKLMKDDSVKAVFIHDLSKDIFERDIAEIVFPNAFFADDAEFIETFSVLDAKKDQGKSHIALIHNSPGAVNQESLNRLLQFYNKNNSVLFVLVKKLVTRNWLFYRMYMLVIEFIARLKRLFRRS